ncbi:MAG: hypothetical protein HQK63_12750 [Desulfamplus sp.]|nr:hypothetical protein [Desulfamplus sp.]
MIATFRLLQIEEKFGQFVERIVPIEFDEGTLRIILYFYDGSNLRVTEQWEGEIVIRYSYYWLNSDNTLKVGWDNAPHHKNIEGFPHHKHIEKQKNIESSPEKTLEDVMAFIVKNLRKLQ